MVSGAALVTVTVTAGLEVVVLPAASRATAVTVWVPLATVVEFHDTEYGAVVSSAPTLVPSTLNWTPATPTLSAALAVKFTADPTPSPRPPARSPTPSAPWCRGPSG